MNYSSLFFFFSLLCSENFVLLHFLEYSGVVMAELEWSWLGDGTNWYLLWSHLA